MEWSGFFNDNNGDRQYDAVDWAKFITKLVSSGLLYLGDNLKVEHISNSDIMIKKGSALIEGYGYELTEDKIITLDVGGSSTRIDKIVLRLDRSEDVRNISLKVINGNMVRNETIYDLLIAEITVNAGQTFVNPDNIVDKRDDYSVCGVAHSTNQEAQIDTWFDNIKEKYRLPLVGEITLYQSSDTAQMYNNNSYTIPNWQLYDSIRFEVIWQGKEGYYGNLQVILNGEEYYIYTDDANCESLHKKFPACETVNWIMTPQFPGDRYRPGQLVQMRIIGEYGTSFLT
ncbi:hypothetical protein [Methanococcus voltae]|uniref:Uncharacterized protein n=1 Tax=Methanococcus voltae (strain ATCC BAA-1334 / A3) TaxID=456320 RepID=D7DSF2_METV3|nr:hypothetical protein [Methanococcus voltae]MCS3901588.1 hypothetical protein [Methanococcus voltae]